MKSILVVTSSFPDHNNGSEAAGAFVHDFCAELAKYCRVTVVAPSEKGISHALGNLTIHSFLAPKLPLSTLKVKNPMDWWRITKTLIRGRNATIEAADSCNADYILAFWVLPCGAWARAASRRFSINYAVWALGSDIWDLGKIPIVNQVLTNLLRDANNCYADGYELKNIIEKKANIQAAFMPSTRDFPLNDNRQFPKNNNMKLSFLGRWHPNKGIDLLIESLYQLDDNDWKLVEEIRIAGGGPLQHKVTHAVENLRKSGKPVKQLGFLNKEEASQLLQWTDYLLLPSKIESIPVIFSDAAKSLTPMISTPTGDLRQLVTSKNCGFVSDSHSTIDYTKTIRLALKSDPSVFIPGLMATRQMFSLKNIVDGFIKTL